MNFDEEGEEIVCASNTILNHQNKQKCLRYIHISKRKKKVVRVLSPWVCTPTAGL